MQTIFDPETRTKLIRRIKSLNENNQAEWGKMNVYQMLKHCTLADELYTGKKTYKRAFLGLIIGKFVLKQLTKDDKPMRPNSPTAPQFIVKEQTGDIEAEKLKWIAFIESYAKLPEGNFNHWFFGEMTREQIGILAYKHTDHHLRQFNA